MSTRDKARNPFAVRYPSGGFMAGHFGHDLGLTVHPISSSGRFSSTARQADWEKQSPMSCQKTKSWQKTRQETLGSGPADSGPHAHAIGDQAH